MLTADGGRENRLSEWGVFFFGGEGGCCDTMS